MTIDEAFDEATKPNYIGTTNTIDRNNVLTEIEGIEFA